MRVKKRVKRNIKKEILTFVLLLLLVVVAFFVSIKYYVAYKEPLIKSAHEKTNTLLYGIRMGKTRYAKGEPIELILEVRNISNKPVMLKFDESLEYDFIVKKEKNFFFVKVPMVVWRYSGTVGSRKEKHTVTLQPQEVRQYKAIWDQKDFNGKQVTSGTYIITGIVNTAGHSTELQLRGRMER